MKDFSGKVAVITGAGRGIGRGIALRCAKEGMKVVLAGIGIESLTKTSTDLRAMGVETLIVQTDVSKLEEMENLAKRTLETFGAVHLLVNNAGVADMPSFLSSKTMWENDLADWEWVMKVNFWGVLYGVRTFVPIMMQQATEGHVVNVSSYAGIIAGRAYFHSYDVSKHTVVALSEALYYELADRGSLIKASVYCPAVVNTDIIDSERNRSAEFQTSSATAQLTSEQQARRDWLMGVYDAGKTIEEAADICFEGIQEDKLYIGVQVFGEQFDRFGYNLFQERYENILNERNPKLPS